MVTQLMPFCLAKSVYEIIAGFKFISNTDLHMILFFFQYPITIVDLYGGGLHA